MPDGILSPGLIFFFDFLIGVPDGRFHIVPRHNLHEAERLFHIGIQREYLQDGIQDFRHAVSVHPDYHSVLSHRFRREIPVRNHNTVTVPHFTQNLQKLGR